MIFRKKEWFKVFIHEAFHNFGLDFSNMNLSQVQQRFRQWFPISSKFNIYEGFTEF